MKRAGKRGFTLIELLVALAILGVIVVICGQIFQQSTVAWNTGTHRAEVNMVGRGLAGFIAQDLSRCVCETPSDLSIAGSSVKFKVIDEASVTPASPKPAILSVTYDLVNRTRNGKILAPAGMVQRVVVTAGPADSGGIPAYVDVRVTVREDNGLYEADFKSRAWLANRDRYNYDE